MATTGGQLLVQCLATQGVDRVFCVPGESYLVVLDALLDSTIETIVARHEGGAAMMAEADGKATGRPGICLVTRGPGATNAMSGVHVARQDSTPMLLIVGQIARDVRGRDAFQEVDFGKTYADVAKLVIEIDSADRIPEIINRAYNVALGGRPGPVVLSVPEDMLSELTSARAGPRVTPAEPAPDQTAIAGFRRLLSAAKKPVAILGGSRWSTDSVSGIDRWARSAQVPVAVSFRRQHLFDAEHPCYAGDLGLGANPDLIELVKGSDLVILLGTRLSEVASQNYTLLGSPGQKIVQLHAGAEELGRTYMTDLSIHASPNAFIASLETDADGKPAERVRQAHDSYLAWSGNRAEAPGGVQLGRLVRSLSEQLPDDAIITNGAGNYSAWVHRFYRYRRYQTQFAPTSGSMGYGLPAAIAARLRFPDRPVICFAGDGCLQMTIAELGTAQQFGVAVIILVIDNASYGTIRMHQERRFPERISATELVNPDFAALARAYGIFSATVTRTEDFEAAFAAARQCGGPALIHIKTDIEAISPAATISSLRNSTGPV